MNSILISIRCIVGYRDSEHITFHGFRHTYATLQLAAGTDLYTISKMLTHSNVGTTQVYADVVNDLKRKASEQITLK